MIAINQGIKQLTTPTVNSTTAQVGLNVLVINSRPLVTTDGKPIEALELEDERSRIINAFRRDSRVSGKVHLHFLPFASIPVIISAFNQSWDIVHFSGHGSASGNMLLETIDGASQELDAANLLRVFGKNLPKLVVLSMCHSGNLFAQALLKAGVSAIVTIKADTPIADRAAILFNQQFYQALALGQTISDAFHRAQTSVALDHTVGDKQNPDQPWSTRFEFLGDGNPVLVRHEQGDQIQISGLEGSGVYILPDRNRLFIRRERETWDIIRILEGGNDRWVNIHGIVGIGKTELAKSIAHWYSERHIADYVLWNSTLPSSGIFHFVDRTSLLKGLAQQLGISCEGVPQEDIQLLARNKLASAVSLIVVDGMDALSLEEKGAVWKFLADLPKNTKLLTTSRSMFSPQEVKNYALGQLDKKHAVQLFTQLLENAGYYKRNPNFASEEGSLLIAICEKIGGHPLAMEMIATRASHLPLENLWDEISISPRNVLKTRDTISGTATELWQSLQRSYDELGEAEKALFCRLILTLEPAPYQEIKWAGTWTPEIYTIFKTDDNVLEDAALIKSQDFDLLLGELSAHSLVNFIDGRYSLLPVVHYFAEDKVEERGQDITLWYQEALRMYEDCPGIQSPVLRAWNYMYELGLRNFERGVLNSVSIDAGDGIKVKGSDLALEWFVIFTLTRYEALLSDGDRKQVCERLKKMISALNFLQVDMRNGVISSDIPEDQLEHLELFATHDLAEIYIELEEYHLAARTLHREIELLSKRSENVQTDETIAQRKITWSVAEIKNGNTKKASELSISAMSVFKVLGRQDLIGATLETIGTAMLGTTGNLDGAMFILSAAEIYNSLDSDELKHRAKQLIYFLRNTLGEKNWELLAQMLEKSSQTLSEHPEAQMKSLNALTDSVIALVQTGDQNRIDRLAAELKQDAEIFEQKKEHDKARFLRLVVDILEDNLNLNKSFELAEPYQSLIVRMISDLYLEGS